MIYTENLESTRLYTKFLQAEEAKDWAPFFDNEDSTRFLMIDQSGNSLDKANLWIQKQLERYANKQFGLQWIISKETQQKIGMVGLLLQEVESVQQIEIGYHLLPEFRGQGYATEAARMFKDFTFDVLSYDEIISIIHPGNYNSQKVALNNGMKHVANAHFRNIEVYIFKITREQWKRGF
ncbi:MAG: GNAT family N-acetyltransferase [Bacteroidia bacterium]